MIKRLLASSFFIFTFLGLTAQPYGNEWIEYSQKYYKIKITENDVYRLYDSTLTNSGISLNGIDPRNIQIFNNGVEQFIHIEGESDGVFDNTDFIFCDDKNVRKRAIIKTTTIIKTKILSVS